MYKSQVTDRIRVGKDKRDILMSLKSSQQPDSPFQTYADIVTFAASVGLMNQKRLPIIEASKHDPDPIPQDQFVARGYLTVIELAMVLSGNNPRDLVKENYFSARARVFEEYANAGFSILEDALKGSVDLEDSLFLFMSSFRGQHSSPLEDFNLQQFL